MPARTAAEAVEEYRTSAARALSCITSAHVDVGGGYAPSDTPHALVVAGGDPVALRGDSRLTLSVGEQYGVMDEGGNGWRVRLSAYFYAIGQQRGAELITYHWHPQGRGVSTGPHLHVNADVQVGTRWLGKVHLPTGPIALQDVIALAIEELDVMPLRDEWGQLLRETRHR